MTMPKKLASGQGMVSLMRIAASGIDNPDLLRLDDPPELGLDRFLRFDGDQPDAVIERKAGFDGAHDHVERIGEFVEKRLDPAPAAERDEPARQADRRQPETRPAGR